MQYIYGPVQSRRLGLSLGLSSTPHKVCDFDCVYCQLGRTVQKSLERKEYIKASSVAGELSQWLAANPAEAKRVQYITISGSGEPTLNTAIGELIAAIKKITAIPVAVITNTSLLGDAAVRSQLLQADLLVPSLDAVTDDVFQKIDRPMPQIKLEDIIQGLYQLRKEFKGQLWLEVMLVKGINDGIAHIRKLQEVISQIQPDKIQLNSPVRCTAEKDILPLERKQLEKIKEMLGEKCEII